MIGYDAFGDSKPWDQMFEVFLSYAWTTDRLIAGNEFSCFQAPLVYDHEYAVKTIQFRQVCDEVH